MATVSPVIPLALPWDPFSPRGNSLHCYSAMNYPNHHYQVRPHQQHEVRSAHVSNKSVISALPAQDLGTPPTSAPISKRPRSSEAEHTNAEDAMEDEGRKKRSRGRPRLDTKDQTAADRRRTQIRLAQRAYRHRKDTAITTLEQRVKELEKANNDISKEFNAFFNVLVSERLLEAAPHALQRLSSVANRITNTADKVRVSNSESIPADEDDDDDETTAYGSAYQASGLKLSPTPLISPAGPSLVQNTFTQQASLRHQNSLYATCVAPTPGSNPSTITSTSLSAPMIHVPPSVNYEIITVATPHNACFPFYSSMESSSAGQMEGNLVGGPSPYGTIAAPASYSASELTFGRRLHRHSVESALRLIMSLHPSPDRFAAVFGFCLFFESREDIIKRLQAALDSTSYEDLSNWRFPFTNLGGAGTFYPDQSPFKSPSSIAGTMPTGAEGTRSYGRPQETTGMSMGPWGPAVQATRDERIDYGADRRMQMMLAGFEGDFFDSDEVEIHLRQLGILIPQCADFVHTELDIHELGENNGACQASNFVPLVQSTADSGYGSSSSSVRWTTNSSSSASGLLDSSCPPSQQTTGKPPMAAQGQPFIGATPGVGVGFNNTAAASYIMPSANTANNHVKPESMSWPTKLKVTIDVGLLIKELTKRSVCLGRAPGVQRKDINNAIKVAAGIQSSEPK